MSGGLPACMLVVSLALNASFSRTVILMVTFGWAFMYSSAACFQTVFIGSVFWMCHQLIVTGLPDDDAPDEDDDFDEPSSPPPHPAPDEADDFDELSPPPPHPATSSAAAAVAASAQRIDFTISLLLLQ